MLPPASRVAILYLISAFSLSRPNDKLKHVGHPTDPLPLPFINVGVLVGQDYNDCPRASSRMQPTVLAADNNRNVEFRSLEEL